MLNGFSKLKCFVTDIHKQLTVHFTCLIHVAIAHSYKHLQKQVQELHTCGESSTAASTEEHGTLTQEGTSAQAICASVFKLRYWDAFRDKFPVTVNGNAPTKQQATEAGFENYRSYYHKWRDVQYQLRLRYVLDQSVDRKGTKPQESKIIDAQVDWTTNKPTVADVQQAWAPPVSTGHSIENDTSIIKSIIDQKWKGLAIKQFEIKGKGVITTMPFSS
ncbi:uncharacterized protein [Sinocyclocheilus grahami]|uniref:uncharacterized protein n=1 Tax=Sinocyclocheilus grahami TaxID=75366 RepID=UPI0007AD5620|nr:PREDICTED: uncharacterized protein LOC107594454 [Sinocyclocheilus grahami]